MILAAFNALAVLATLAGGRIPISRLSRKGLWRLFALRSGILVSVAFTDILPAAWTADARLAGWGALAAFVLLLYAASLTMVDTCPEYLEECPVHLLGWAALAALFAHSFIDGFNLGVSFSAGPLAGGAVGLALTLHKLADGFTLTSVFRQAGYSPAQVLGGLAAVAAATPLGSAATALGVTALHPDVKAALLGFAGGSFLYIGAADILPRLHRSDDRAALACFGAGILAVAAVEGISP